MAARARNVLASAADRRQLSGVAGVTLPARRRARSASISRRRSPIHHAWISLDGQNAVDQTWPDAEQCSYFGIAFPKELLARACSLRGWWGMLREPVIVKNLPEFLERK